MALFSEVRNERTKQAHSRNRVVEQALLVPEAGILLALLAVGWGFDFPPLISMLALVTVLVFAVRLGLIALAERQLALGAYERADRLVRAALRLNPWSADALVLRAQGLTQRGEDEAAEQVLRRATALYPNDRTLQNALAASIFAQGRITEGRQMTCSDDQGEPSSPQIVQQLAWLALHVDNNPFKARMLILNARPERFAPPIALPLLATLSEAQIMLGAHEEAERVLLTIESELPICPQPQQAELLYHLGRMYAALGQPGAGYFRRCVQVDPAGRYAQSAWRSAINSETA